MTHFRESPKLFRLMNKASSILSRQVWGKNYWWTPTESKSGKKYDGKIEYAASSFVAGEKKNSPRWKIHENPATSQHSSQKLRHPRLIQETIRFRGKYRSGSSCEWEKILQKKKNEALASVTLEKPRSKHRIFRVRKLVGARGTFLSVDYESFTSTRDLQVYKDLSTRVECLITERLWDTILS